MARVKIIATALALAAIGVAASGVAAQETNVSERTFLTFSNSVEMPGTTLPAGTYVFKLADTPTRNVVQVWDNDEKNMMGQWLFVQAERPQVTGDTVIMFKETREGSTPAVQYWYFPGERIGKEFVYPKDQATRIAARTGLDVRSDDGVIEGGGVAAITTETASADTTLQNAPAAAQPTAAAGSLAGNRGAVAEPEPQAEPAPAVEAPVVEQQVARAEVSDRAVGTSGQADALPQTASPLALSGLVGLLSLAGAAGLRASRQ